MELEVSVDRLDTAQSSEQTAAIAVVKVAGEVDVSSIAHLDQELVALTDAGEKRIIVDLSAVEFIDSTGLGVIVKSLKEVRDNGGWLRVVAQNDRVTKIFVITGLDSEVELSESVEQAAAK